ncbi:MAG: dihydropteroate synthase [Flavobacteriaceae bacterium]|jgi:dihydropteroate synthase|nr:dihydropteroate synthase [Flavobacteriaceae bacterium]MBT4960891.1 dihydropteroate synthase [Flavobacteriaceae bacterium]MBT5232823.1 dihydropteroate synthase [Flavobacteriaceae bacterium]MBT5493446.1 dihydropteroate synthase [Flavobacteriaceae bacterium]MDB2648205.1 dihydropteroate synthase [Flavobacteriaceae bacterium]|tara:strand:- start:6176 stop:7006 length:831 start_codon:yes stop_codon:yes gene_type:complete
MILNINGGVFDLSSPKIMGVLNVTPDSFYDGGVFSNEKKILAQVEKMILDGADIIDIGGFSSKPGAKTISLKEEEKRVIPIIKLINKTFNKIIISVDTFRSEIAEKSLNEGASIINDISGGDLDKNIYQISYKYKAPYIMMHMNGVPSNMQNNPKYENINHDIIKDFTSKIDSAEKKGVCDIIIDPGFGFGKTIQHNYQILNNLKLYTVLKKPILVGISRKSMIYKLLKTDPSKALNGTTSLNTIALINGANILRVHDVKEAKEVIKLYSFLKENV